MHLGTGNPTLRFTALQKPAPGTDRHLMLTLLSIGDPLVEDAAEAHLLALERAPEIGLDTMVLSAPPPSSERRRRS